MTKGTVIATPDMSIVIGVQYAQENLPAILSAIGTPKDYGVEILLCHAENDPVDAKFAVLPGVRIVTGKPDALIPELWRDGILAARAGKVAILSAHCIPDVNWTSAALALDLNRCVAYGGVIGNDPASGTTGTAIHLLRYSGFTDIPALRPALEIAADNSVYDRGAILACTDLLPLGFWEPSYHARFRAGGLKLAVTPDLCVRHTNRYAISAFMTQRRLHGRAFGRARGQAAPVWRRWLMLAFAPAAFPVHAIKLTRRILSNPALRAGFWRAAPRFYLFLASWSLGEVRGYADAVFGTGSNRRLTPPEVPE